MTYGAASDGYSMADALADAHQGTKCWKYAISGTHFDSPEYQEMVDLMLKIQEKWGIGVVDLWNNAEMTAVTENEEEISKLMGDPVHPFREGYVNWWLPEFEKAFTEYFEANK